ncbi:MAG: glycerophosphoryl diester phosphodiesterase [Thermoproteota archaeon]|jgi:glycerophosphoryl diester phosphodiesterase
MKIMAHRGGAAEAPENTLFAFERAFKLGVAAVECDVHLSSDGELIVIHDETVDRTTNGVGKVKDLTLAQIKKLDAGSGECVPTLDELFNLVQKYNGQLMIEIKSGGCEEAVIKAIKKYDYFDHTMVICFNHRVLQLFKSMNKKVKTGCLLLGLPVNAPGIAKEAFADAIVISHLTVDEALVKQCKDENIIVGVWNISNELEYEYFKAMGIEYAGTDYPELLSKL